MGHQDPGEFPEEVKALFEKAVQYYEDNMMLMVEIGDRAAQGRACGNLGNVHYLLGNFSRAIHFHQERLKIAKEFRYYTCHIYHNYILSLRLRESATVKDPIINQCSFLYF